LLRVGLEPVILEDQPNRGQTIIEKIESNTSVAYAVVLLTPDDLGAMKGRVDLARQDLLNVLQPRARQNAVFELGYLLGLLGRSRVAALYVDGVEMPSDYTGVVYIRLDSEGAWKKKLVSELKAAKLEGNFDAIL